MRLRTSRIVLVLYGLYLLIPLYWLLSMALRSNADIVGEFSVVPMAPTLANFREIFANPVWYEAFLNSLSYVFLNTLISLAFGNTDLTAPFLLGHINVGLVDGFRRSTTTERLNIP